MTDKNIGLFVLVLKDYRSFLELSLVIFLQNGETDCLQNLFRIMAFSDPPPLPTPLNRALLINNNEISVI